MPDAIPPGDHVRELVVGGRERTYRIHLPTTGQRPWPVVLGFHGGASHGRAFESSSGLSEKADLAGFVAVYPNGTGEHERLLYWNAGNCCGHAYNQEIDDVAFIRALLDDLATVLSIDTPDLRYRSVKWRDDVVSPGRRGGGSHRRHRPGRRPDGARPLRP